MIIDPKPCNPIVVSAATLLLVQTVGVRGDGPPAYGSPYQSPNYAYQYAVKDDYAGVDFSAGKILFDWKTFVLKSLL